MIFLTASVEFYRGRTQIVFSSHRRDDDGFLLGQLRRPGLRQKGNTAIIVFPVLDDRHQPAILQHAEGAHRITVDIAVQPLHHQILLFLIQIIFINPFTVLYQEIRFQSRSEIIPREPLDGLAQLPAVIIDLRYQRGAAVAAVAVISGVCLSVPAAADLIQPHISRRRQGNRVPVISFSVEEPDLISPGQIQTSLFVHTYLLNIFLPQPVRNLLIKHILSFRVKSGKVLFGTAVILGIDTYHGVESAVRSHRIFVQVIVALLRPHDGIGGHRPVRQRITAEILGLFFGLLIPVPGDIIEILPCQLHIVKAGSLILKRDKFRHIDPFLLCTLFRLFRTSAGRCGQSHCHRHPQRAKAPAHGQLPFFFIFLFH